MHNIIVSLLVGGIFVTALAGPGSAGVPCVFGDYNGGGIACPFDDSGSGGSAGVFQEVDPVSLLPCPFDDSGSGGSAGVFEEVDPVSLLPCPFDDSGSGGSAGVFEEVNPVSELPCPFQRSVASSEENGSPAITGEETYPVPADTDDDGLYEDLNGNGQIDFADLILYFNQMDWIRENQPLCCFDYNGNGNIDFADVIMLFQEI